MKFAFIIPFRPKSESTDWINESFLLKKTIRSLLRQTYQEFHVFVVYTDYPLIEIIDQRVTYVQFLPGFKEYNDILKRDELLASFGSEQLVVRRWDKGRKLSFGSAVAINADFDYVMAIDADDRLSKYFLENLIKSADGKMLPGWYMEAGYLMQQHGSLLLCINKGFKNFNGSSHVLRRDLVRIPDFSSNDWLDYNLFTDHGWIQQRINDEYNEQLIPITNPSLIYVAHQSNISKVYKEYGNSFRKILKRILRSKMINKRLIDEYYL